MKKIYNTGLILFSLCFANLLYAQTIISTKKDSVALRTDPDATQRAQSVYFEIFGNGSAYSLNYDTRFNNRPDGLGGRVGLSYFLNENENFFSAPIVLNYLAGKRGKYFEAGAGLTFYSGNVRPMFYTDSDYDYADDQSNGIDNLNKKQTKQVFGTLIFGYRSQPTTGGFMFRAGISPVIAKQLFIPWWPYASFGYKF